MKKIIDDIPSAAWKRRFDQRAAKPGKPSRPLNLKFLIQILPMLLRMRKLARQQKDAGFNPINLADPPHYGDVMGVPLGGIGCGSITRGWRGDFLRWQLRAGMPHVQTVYADQFSLYVKQADGQGQAQVLNPNKPPDRQLESWKWEMPSGCATYHALFPRAWTVYEQPLAGVRLVCKQVSPVIPHNYKESSYPDAVFEWTIENTSTKESSVSLMFTFQNGMGLENDGAGGHWNTLFSSKSDAKQKAVGIALHHKYRQKRIRQVGEASSQAEEAFFEDPLTFAMAVKPSPGLDISYQTRFNTLEDGSDLWQDFCAQGRLGNRQDKRPARPGESIGAALAASYTLKSGQSKTITFTLAWDMPVARFGLGTAYFRRYTQFYGRKGNSAQTIASDALKNYKQWEKAIHKWQQPILEDKHLPDWYKMALFNELYYIVDGGTIWGYPADAKSKAGEETIGHFAYLEGHPYPMYNTYDVHFYASFALAMLWPKLELSLQRDIAQATMQEYADMVEMVYDGKITKRKVAGMVPHDIGWPMEDPWRKVNGYFIHDINEWKDLNPKFVLQVYRDYVLTKDKQFLAQVWPIVKETISQMQKFDQDGDGLIENSGFPDQTYDTWTVVGASAYTGGLWLACLRSTVEMAKVMGEKEQAQDYLQWFTRAQNAYESKLWNGTYYNYDSSPSPQHNSIMADMLAGQWYAHACGLPPILDQKRIRSSLKAIYVHNVLAFQGGKMGAVNGMRPNGKIDKTTLQSQEVWTGTTYALAACMLQEGLQKEAWQTAKGVVDMTYDVLGYWFQTPEAWMKDGSHRAICYMRPLCIWAMQHAWNHLVD